MTHNLAPRHPEETLFVTGHVRTHMHAHESHML